MPGPGEGAGFLDSGVHFPVAGDQGESGGGHGTTISVGYAPNLISLPAWARARGMTSVAGNSPRTPWAQAFSVNSVTGSGRDQGAHIMKGTGCQLWLAQVAGVEWSPATIKDVGAEVDDLLERGVDLFQRADLGVEVSVFACGVGALVVDEEEIVVFVVGDHFVDYLGECRVPWP